MTPLRTLWHAQDCTSKRDDRGKFQTNIVQPRRTSKRSYSRHHLYDPGAVFAGEVAVGKERVQHFFWKFIDTYIYTCHIYLVKSWSSKDILKVLFADGWFFKHQVGSHVQLIHPSKQGKVTVAHPKKDVPIKTVKSIFRQAGIPLED